MIDKIFNKIKEDYTDKMVYEMLDNEILDWIDYKQMNELNIDNEFEYYNEYCDSEAEDAITESLIKIACNKININYNDIADYDLFDLQEKIKEYYDL